MKTSVASGFTALTRQGSSRAGSSRALECSEHDEGTFFSTEAGFNSIPTLKSSVRSSHSTAHLTINKLRFDRLDLYGREEETKILRDSFEQMASPKSSPAPPESAPENGGQIMPGAASGPASQSRRQLVLIDGMSGVGKTALAQSLEDPVARRNGFFLTGKFDLNQRHEPYSGLVAAIRSLCMILLDLPRESDGYFVRSSKPTFERVTGELQEQLGGDGQILVQLVPMLGGILGHGAGSVESSPVKVGVMESQIQFNFAFQRFMRVIASFGPLVLVMDDLQWSDVATMSLLEVLLQDGQLQNFMVIGLYRSNEVDETHLVDKWIREIEETSQSDGTAIQKVQLGNLTQPNVNQMMADLLSTDTEATEELSKIVHKKTLGNAFFVTQFLQSLNDQGLLEFNFGLNKWLWNTEEIATATKATENVLELMKTKITKLPRSVCQILPIAACLGSKFSEDVLTLLVDNLPNMDAYLEPVAYANMSGGSSMPDVHLDTFGWLAVCLNEALIEQVGTSTFQFVHDKIQAVALDLVPAEKLPSLMFQLGEILCEKLSPEAVEHHVFIIANMIGEYEHASPPVELTGDKKLQIAQLYLKAGSRANQAASFNQGAVYLRKAIDLLPENHWESHYKLSLELYSLAAEAELVIGDVDNMQDHCNQVIEREDCPIEDKFRAYNVQIESIAGHNRSEDAIQLILKVLSMLGCHLPKRGLQLRVVAGLIKVKMTLKNRTPEKIAQLKTMKGQRRIQCMKLLDKLTSLAYYGGSDILPLVVLKRLQWTIKYGVSEFSPPAFSAVGHILCNVLGDIHGGRTYVEHAIALLDKLDCRAVEARTLAFGYIFVMHWSVPLHDCLKPLLRLYETGLLVGDMEMAYFGIFFNLEFALFAGKPLQGIKEDFQVFIKPMKQHKQMYHHGLSMLLLQGILHLQGHSSNPLELRGEVITEEFIKDVESRKDDGLIVFIHRMQLFLAYWFCEDGDEEGANLGLLYGEEEATVHPGVPCAIHCRIQAAVLCLDACRRSGKKKYLNYGRKVAGLVKSMVDKGNPNVLQFDALLDAELAVVGKKYHRAMKHYETAALIAGRRGFLQDQAKINERFADFALNFMGDEHEAEFRIKEAVKLYSEWGAHGKVKQLENKYKQFFKTETLPSEIVLH